MVAGKLILFVLCVDDDANQQMPILEIRTSFLQEKFNEKA